MKFSKTYVPKYRTSGFGINLLKSPSVADPSEVYSYILYCNLYKWGFCITFGRK
jgi:hypothetical protein